MGSIGETVFQGKKFNTGLTDYSKCHADNSGPYAENLEVDALVVGAGFAGVYMLKSLRDRGLRTVIFEAGNDTGGTWRWNCYPGAGVDSAVPEYEFDWPEVYNTWNWPSRYPGYQDLRNYFDHVDKIIGVKKDCAFNTVVVGGQFDTSEGKWNIQTADGRTTKAKYFILGAGFSAKRYVPPWPGMDRFKGIVHHSSFWPEENINVKDKRCAIIGTGASGVQITQAWAPKAGDLTVFQRTPNLAVPMLNRDLTVKEQENIKPYYPELFRLRETTFAGFLYGWSERSTFDDTPQEREAYYERIWNKGDFHYWVGTYKDLLFDSDANKEAYNFWAKKTRSRIGNPKTRELLAPREMPYYFGTKRPSVENHYFEQFNRESVHLVSIKNNPIKEFTETGITLEDGTHHEFDVIAVATGFDVATGVMTQLGLKSIDGTELEKEWIPGAKTYLGMTVNGYPNMFHLYGPQSPTILSNGPTTIAVQARWISDAIAKIEANGVKYINPMPEAADQWKKHVLALNDSTLLPTTRSTYMGGSIPGKAYEPICYSGGIPAYASEIRKALDNWDEGFYITKA